MIENMPKTAAACRAICEGLSNAPPGLLDVFAEVYAGLANPPPMKEWIEQLPTTLFFLACNLSPELAEVFKQEMWEAHGEALYHQLRNEAEKIKKSAE